MATTYPSSYSTVEDIYQTLPQVGSVSNVTSANIQYQIGRVEATMNAKLSRVYTLPFSQSILQLTTISTELTIYELMKRFSVLSKLKDAKDSSQYKDAMTLLEDIVSGKVPLLDASFVVISKPDGAGQKAFSNNMGFTPTFSEDSFTSGDTDTEKFD